MMDELERHRQDILARKRKQNERRIKAGKPVLHKNLEASEKKARERLAKLSGTAPRLKNGLPMPESGDIDDSAMSFEEWKEFGYCVKKGEKAKQFSAAGEGLFTMLQVHKINPAWEKWRKRNPK